MKKIWMIAMALISGLVVMGFISIQDTDYKYQINGRWEIASQTVYLADTTLHDTLPPGTWHYFFSANDSVTITIQDADTTTVTMGWALDSLTEDTLYFSEGGFMYLYNKTPTSFDARFPLDVNTTEYVEAHFIKL